MGEEKIIRCGERDINMCGNNGCLWIVIIIILLACGGCGSWGNWGCGNNGCGCNGGCGCNNGCGC